MNRFFLIFISVSFIIGAIPTRDNAILFCLNPEVDLLNISNDKILRIDHVEINKIIQNYSISSICKNIGIEDKKKVHELTDQEILKIREYIEKNHKVEGDLRSEVTLNIKRLTDLVTYRGLRHRKKLPVRGQRTHTNARTRKGKGVAIANKKKVTA